MAKEYKCEECNDTIENGDLVFVTKEGIFLHTVNFGRELIFGDKTACSFNYGKRVVSEKGIFVGSTGVFYEGEAYGEAIVQKLFDKQNREFKYTPLENDKGVRVTNDLKGLDKIAQE